MIYLVAVCLILYDFLFHCIGQYFSTNFKAVANLNVLKKLWHPRAAGKVEYSTLSHVLTFTSRQDWSNEKNIAREKIGRAVMNAAENSFACLKRSFKSATSCFQFYFLRRCYMTYFSDLSLCMEQKLSEKEYKHLDSFIFFIPTCCCRPTKNVHICWRLQLQRSRAKMSIMIQYSKVNSDIPNPVFMLEKLTKPFVSIVLALV